MATEIETALANEARRLELKTKLASINGTLSAVSDISQRLDNMSNMANTNKALLSQQLVDLELGAGAGVTSSFGPKSAVTQFIESERQAAKSASIDFIKANAVCTEQEAADAWDTAAVAAHPEFPMPIQDGLAMGRLYRANLLRALLIPENTWEAQRSWIVSTPKDTIMNA